MVDLLLTKLNGNLNVVDVNIIIGRADRARQYRNIDLPGFTENRVASRNNKSHSEAVPPVGDTTTRTSVSKSTAQVLITC